MSLELRCDICDKTGEWKLRKRFRLFATRFLIPDGYSDVDVDICDSCLIEFSKYIRRNKEKNVS